MKDEIIGKKERKKQRSSGFLDAARLALLIRMRGSTRDHRSNTAVEEKRRRKSEAFARGTSRDDPVIVGRLAGAS